MWWAVVPSVAALGVTVLAPTALGPICKWWTFGIARDRSIWEGTGSCICASG
uniref:Uncharacterized protein n=1 Tax=Tetranychus urticae TaxID=32264 RepID=T1L039_TETUR